MERKQVITEKLNRLQETIYRAREIFNKLSTDVTPGMRQSLRKQAIDAEANIKHQANRIEEEVTGSLWKITYKENNQLFYASYMNCTETEALILVRIFSKTGNIQVLEVKEEVANPRPVKL